MFYSCPVCGYSQMTEPPKDYAICPSCATEFGYSDFSKNYRQLRNEWLANGANWFSSATGPPFLWNGFRQVAEAGLPYDIPLPHSPTQTFEFRIPGVRALRELSVLVS